MSYAVLICDDDTADRTALCEELRDLAVLEAATGALAREAMAAQRFDAIVASDRELLWFVRTAYPAMYRVLVSEESVEAIVDEINAGVAHRFFHKPCDAARLRSVIERELVTRVRTGAGDR